MMQVISPLKGFGIEATDGALGSVVDFLFDDTSWTVRWLVVECGTWRRGHKVLIHPSAITATDFEDQRFAVKLTKEQVAASPDWFDDLPVSQQMLSRLYDHYGWDPEWGAPYVGEKLGAMASPFMSAPYLGLEPQPEPAEDHEPTAGDDAHLRSFAEIVGYKIHASDGEIGHIENFMMDDSNWALRYLVVDTSNWWFGKRVLLATSAVTEIDWSDRRIRVDVTRAKVETSPPWDPMIAFDGLKAKLLHDHYGWPGSMA